MNASASTQNLEWNPLGPGLVTWRLAFFCLLLLSLVTRGHAEPLQPVSVINVLVLYTPQASVGAGGTTSILKLIDAAVVEANTVFQNSRINARIHLALAARINYLESGSVSNDLARLREPGNSTLGQAHRLRDQFGANLVCLITETGSDWWFYGLQGPSPENAFSIVRRPYLTGGYYFPVALSFNFGCQLERPYANSAGAFPYSYGYSFWVNDTLYSTVEGFSGQRIPFFSNPDILFQGVPLGVPAGLVNAANNALVMNQTAPIVATFRGSASRTWPPSVKITAPAGGATFRSGTSVTLAADARDPDGNVTQVDYYEGTNWLASSGTARFIALWPKVPIGEHSLLAVATDNDGATTVSAPIQITVRPANDDFAARTKIIGTNVTERVSNALATAEPGEPDHAGVPANHSLWWTWTAPSNGIAWVEIGGKWGTTLAIYTGSVVSELSPVASNIGYESNLVEFRVVSGTTYQIALDSLYGDTGDISFGLFFVPPPANDDFSHRKMLKGTHINEKASLEFASREPGEPNHGAAPGHASMWWSWTAPAPGVVIIQALSEVSAPLLLGVYTGEELTNLLQIFRTELFWPSSTSLRVEAGTRLQFAVDSMVSPSIPCQGCNFLLQLDFFPPPPNDNFADRTPISGTWITLTNSSVGATLEPGEPDNGAAWPSIWWSWRAPV